MCEDKNKRIKVDENVIEEVKKLYPEYSDLTITDIVKIALRKMIKAKR